MTDFARALVVPAIARSALSNCDNDNPSGANAPTRRKSRRDTPEQSR
jgi:hypothetical protein